MADSITLLGRAENGTYFPLVSLDLASLRGKGFRDHFMLEYAGQIDQLKVIPSACGVSTPQDDDPEHPLDVGGYGGKPGLVGRREIENVTVLFATGQSKT